jgi:hypothetical protein
MPDCRFRQIMKGYIQKQENTLEELLRGDDSPEQALLVSLLNARIVRAENQLKRHTCSECAPGGSRLYRRANPK